MDTQTKEKEVHKTGKNQAGPGPDKQEPVTERYEVRGMTCAACQNAVTRAVEKLDGVDKANVNLMTNSMDVSYDPAKVNADLISDSVAKAGYEASPEKKGKEKQGQTKEGKRKEKSIFEEDAENLKRRLQISIPFLAILMYVAMSSMGGWPIPAWMEGRSGASNFALTQLLLALPVLITNRSFFSRGFKSLFRGTPNMDALIAIGSAASFGYGVFALFRINYGLGYGDMGLVDSYRTQLYFEGSAMILTLISLGKYMEVKSKIKTTSSLQKLMDLQPDTARVLVDGKETMVPIEEVQVGDIISIKPGERVPLDGEIVQGQSSIDESAITGESIPVYKKAGDKVVGATMNKSGAFYFKTQAVGEDTTLSQIIKLVKDANASKAPIQSLADKIAGIFVPTVILIAIAVFIGWKVSGQSFEFAFRLAISVLVISCPCALGLATPVVLMVATGMGAENGLLIKSGEALESLPKAKTVVLDKTGTITEGKPFVTDLILQDPDWEADQALQVAYSLEQYSEQPLAEALVEAAEKIGLAPLLVDDFKPVTGRGIQGKVTIYENPSPVLVGSLAFMEENGVKVGKIQDRADSLARQGKTPIYLAVDGEIKALLAASDRVKESSRQAIQALHDRGLKTVMLTGDKKETAQTIAKEVGIDDFVAEVLPQDKEAIVRKLQGDGDQSLVMVGDGINDAPALTRADVGVAIGAGTDIAIDSADLVLVKSSLQDLAAAYDLASRSMRKIKQNYFWAFFYNVICIPLAAGALYPAYGITLNPMISAAAMSLSSIFVVTNALTLYRFKFHGRKGDEDDRPEAGEIRVSRIGEGQTSSQSPKPGQASRASLSGQEENSIPNENKENKKDKKKGRKTMWTTVKVNGMMCEHCRMNVEKALDNLAGVKAEVDLDKGLAKVSSDRSLSEEELKQAIEDAGYEYGGLVD